MKVRLGDVGQIITGNTPKTSDVENYSSKDIAFIKPSDIQEDGLTILSGAGFYISEHAREKARILNRGCILVTCIGIVGKVAINSIECAFNQQINAIVPDAKKCDTKFIAYAIQNQQHRLQDIANAAVVPILNKTQFSNIEIPLPSLDEQRRIAAVLDKVSDLIVKRRAQLDKLDELVKARFVEMFGDPYINSMAWKKIKIKAAVTVEPQNGMYKPQSDYVTDGSGTPILRIDGFYDGIVTDFSSLKRLRCNDNEKQKYLLKENDIVINRVNSIEYLGKCAHITGLIEETVYESNMMRMHFDPVRFNPVYVTHLLCSRFVYDQVINHAKKAVNQASINQKDVLDFDIYQPSIERQNVFADFVNRADQSKLTIQQSLDKLEILKKALMQEYFG